MGNKLRGCWDVLPGQPPHGQRPAGAWLLDGRALKPAGVDERLQRADNLTSVLVAREQVGNLGARDAVRALTREESQTSL